MVAHVKELAPSPTNPRIVTEEKLKQLGKAIDAFGDLSGIVFNRITKTIVSGHQRAKVFGPDAKITIEKQYQKPTRTGTVAEGSILVSGERYKYREVSWDSVTEKAARIAANRNAGDWNNALLANDLRDIADIGLDPDTTMFSKKERDKIFAGLEEKKPKTEKSRSASGDVKEIKLSFTAENYETFLENIEYFQKILEVDSITDTIIEVLQSARAAQEGGEVSDEEE